MYTQKQKQEIDRVISVFSDYIHTNKNLDVVWSEKLGYVLLNISPDEDTLIMEPELIEDGEHLLQLLLSEISLDVLEKGHCEHDKKDATSLEKAEMIRCMEPYTKQLPEYQRLVKRIFTEVSE